MAAWLSIAAMSGQMMRRARPGWRWCGCRGAGAAHRTRALREAIGRSPDEALTLLHLRSVTDTVRSSSATGRCPGASVRHVSMSAWEAAIWDYPTSRGLALLARCLGFGIDALHERVNPCGAGISARGLTCRTAPAVLVARAADPDMVEAGPDPHVLRRADPAARDGAALAEGQGEDAGQPGDVALPAFLTADLAASGRSMVAAG